MEIASHSSFYLKSPCINHISLYIYIHFPFPALARLRLQAFFPLHAS
jgi:hypothetical protein